jgi:YNFM family putative membrane transporter
MITTTFFNKNGIGNYILFYKGKVNLVTYYAKQVWDLYILVILWGIFVFMLGTAGFFIADYHYMLLSMFIFYTGMFAVHTVLSGFLNKLLQENKALANGLYLSFYYTGGAIGSFVPGIFYKYWGWDIFLFILLIILSCSIFLTLRLKKAINTKL